jgi:hypothetical protein
MSDDQNTQANPDPQAEPYTAGNEQAAATGEPQPTPSMEDSWREVGKQFETLGQGIAQAFRSAGSTEQAKEMKTGLEAMVQDIGRAIRDAAESPEGQKVRAETNRTVESLRTAGEQTVREVRPQVISALKQLNDELMKLVNRIEQG